MSEHDSHRLSVRFGEEILARGHTAIPNLVLNYYVRLGLSGPELLFTIHVWQHWWSDRDPYPSLRTIAARMGISVRQAKRYVESLEHKGFLRVVERFLPDGSQTTNEFDYSPLIRAVVAAARADGALGPATSGPAIVRRTRQRVPAGDTGVTPSPAMAVTPSGDAADTPTLPALATGAPTAASPKEEPVHADQSHADDVNQAATPLDEVIELLGAVNGRTVTVQERVAMQELARRYAAAAARATPPATSAEWLAAAIAAAVERGGPVTARGLEPFLEEWARPPRATAPASLPAGSSAPNLGELWSRTLADLREQILPTNFSRWLARTRLLSRAPGQAVVGVPDQVCAEQLARRLDPLVRRALSEACGEALTVTYRVCS